MAFFDFFFPKKKETRLPSLEKSFVEFRNIKNSEVIFSQIAASIIPYVPSVNSTITRKGKMWTVLKVHANYDMSYFVGPPIVVWLKEIPDD